MEKFGNNPIPADSAGGKPFETMTEKEKLTAVLAALAEDCRVRQKDSVNGMMAPEFVSVDSEAMTATFRYKVHPWEGNRVGFLHGGIMTTMLDHVCGLTVSAWLGHWAPTMTMSTDFIRPANVGDSLLVTAEIISMGSRLIRMRGSIVNEESSKLIAACTATFFNKEA